MPTRSPHTTHVFDPAHPFEPAEPFHPAGPAGSPGAAPRPVRPRRPARLRRRRRVGAAVACSTLLTAGLVPLLAAGATARTPARATTGTATPASPMSAAAIAPAVIGAGHDVVANLFEWNWPSVAKECRTVLGPAGYGAVQVAPPQDSLDRTAAVNPAILHPWWEVYQPVDYSLTSRMGNETQFRAMVGACRKAGVRVIVDAVINHTTGQGDHSYGGVTYSKYDYPGVYTAKNFHHAPADCPTADGAVDDFNSYRQVTRCELVGLADLRTESPYVRSTLAGYLNKLLAYGVSGFRIDAAKHIGQTDLTAIESTLHRTVDGTRPYIALEVATGSPGALSPQAFEGQGSLLGFDFASQVESAFTSYTTAATGSISDLRVFGAQAGLLPGGKSLAFVENHDTERNGSTLSYKDGATNTIADEFMLAYGYGTPEVYSSFTFATADDSPPSTASGHITNTVCGAAWTCLDRVRGIAHLVGWHDAVTGTPVAHWWDNGQNLISFSRGTRGWIAINNATAPGTHTFTTGLPAGRYCDVVNGTAVRTAGHVSCSGPVVTVDARGRAAVTVPAKDSVAFALDDRLG